MARCAAIKANGERRRLDAVGKQDTCWAHSPENSEQRRKRASRGGRAKANRELPQIKTLLEDLTERVLSGELPTGPAAVANQLINTRLRAIELERKIREAEEIEERLTALEDLASSAGRAKPGGSRWGTLGDVERRIRDLEGLLAPASPEDEEAEL